MNRPLFALLILLISGVAMALRCPELELRPLHNDEAVNAIKFRGLWEKGVYRYDPNEHHGPTIFYATLAWNRLVGAARFVDINETGYRMVTVLFGVGLILLLPLISDGLGRGATIWAAILTAVSPAMVFYSRYYIHEMLLVWFTFLGLAASWRYFQTKRLAWAIVAGIGFGLMQATKETFVMTLAALGGALVVNLLWETRFDSPPNGLSSHRPWFSRLQIQTLWSAIRPLHLAIAVMVWLFVAILLFSSFFTNPGGPVDSLRTYLPWANRAAGASPHLHPWYYYLARLAWFHERKGPVFTETLIPLFAVIGGFAGFSRFRPTRTHGGLLRILALYAFFLTAIYAVIAYKTPWCLLSFWHPLILLAGVGVMTVTCQLRQYWKRWVIYAVTLVAATQLAHQAWQLDTVFATDQRNPYIYSQTSTDFLELVERVQAIAKASPYGNHLLLKVMAPEDDYWPLPWYLRAFDQVGWYGKTPVDPLAPIIIASTRFSSGLEEQKTHTMIGFFELRPQVFLQVYVEAGLWKSYLANRPQNAD